MNNEDKLEQVEHSLDGESPRCWVLDEDENAKPCWDIKKWVKIIEGNRKVANDVLQDDTIVSTVFLGLDHSFGLGGPPVLWETMIFGGVHNEYQDRYCSKQEAIKGHEKALKLAVKDLVEEDPVPSSEWIQRWEVVGTSNKKYVVARKSDGTFGCDCPSWKFQRKVNGVRRDCQHILSKKLELQVPIAASPSTKQIQEKENSKIVRKIRFED